MKRILLLFTLFLSFFSYNFAYNYIMVNDLNTTNGTLIDVRSIYARERDTRFQKGSTWIDPHSLMDINDFLKLNIYNKEQPFIIYCSCPNDEYSIAMAELMDREGFTHVYILKNGWDELVESTYFIQ